MFGLFNAGETWMGERRLETRVFRFADEGNTGSNTGSKTAVNDMTRRMELRVYRSKARVRMEPEVEGFKTMVANAGLPRSTFRAANGGVSLVNAGFLPPEHPRRYYKYALLDPLDQPFATFHYYYRNWGWSTIHLLYRTLLMDRWIEQLDAIGVMSPNPSAASSTRSAQQFDRSFRGFAIQEKPNLPSNAEVKGKGKEEAGTLPPNDKANAVSNPTTAEPLIDLSPLISRTSLSPPPNTLFAPTSPIPFVKAFSPKKGPRPPTPPPRSSTAPVFGSSPRPPPQPRSNPSLRPQRRPPRPLSLSIC